MRVDPHLFEPVELIIKAYLLLNEKRSVGLTNASYSVGSLALSEFNECSSDIDFIIIPKRRATPVDLELLRAIHQSLEKAYPRWEKSGSSHSHE